MTEIMFGKATALPKKIVAGVSGPTGAGKSYSALELGTGLVPDPEHELFMVDTEFGRGAHYANSYAFQYGQLGPPFTPDRYQEAIEASIAAGAQCTIVDSLSHMWEGESGLLDWHGDIALKMARGDEARAEIYNFPAWREPKQALQKFVLYLQRCPIHLILCLRAKERSKMVKTVGHDGRTRTEIVTVGLQPIIDTATPYEATFLAMLSPEEPGIPHWTHKALAEYLQPIFENGKHLSRSHGRLLAQWCGGHGAAPTEAIHRPPIPYAKDLWLSKRRADEIMGQLRVSPSLQELKSLWADIGDEITTASPEGQRAIENVYTYRQNTLTAEQSSDGPMRWRYGLPPPGAARTSDGNESVQDSDDTSAPAGEPSAAEQAPPKRRGRPPGSKNRPKEPGTRIIATNDPDPEPRLNNEDWASASDAAIAAGQPAEDKEGAVKAEEYDQAMAASREFSQRYAGSMAGLADSEKADSDDDDGPTGPLYKLQDPGTGADLGPFPPDEFIRMVKVLAEEPMTDFELARLRTTTAGPLKEIAASIPGLRDASTAVRDLMAQRAG